MNKLPKIKLISEEVLRIERAILGAAIIERTGALRLFDGIRSEKVFYSAAHQNIYKAIKHLFDASTPIDILTLTMRLRSEGLLEAVGGAAYLAELTGYVATSSNTEVHIKILLQEYIRREMIYLAYEESNRADDLTQDVFDVLDRWQSRLLSLQNSIFEVAALNFGQMVYKTVGQIEARSQQHSYITGIPTGLKLDKITGGWADTDLIILAARPSMGKTTFALYCALVAAKKQIPVLFFSLEMSASQIITKMLATQAQVDSDKLRRGFGLENEWENINAAAALLASLPIQIEEQAAQSINQVRTKSKLWALRHKQKGIIFVDYIQLMQGEKGGNREQEVASISRGLKGVAKELDMPVIALSQLSRSLESRSLDEKRPRLSDLRESGSIEQDADVVTFLFRPEYYGLQVDENGNSTQGMTETIVAKQRNGTLGTACLYMDPTTSRFSDEQQSYLPKPAPRELKKIKMPYADTDKEYPF